MWEYNKITIYYKIEKELVKKMNELGSDNWEIISIVENKPEKFGKECECIILMKRKKVDNNIIL